MANTNKNNPSDSTNNATPSPAEKTPSQPDSSPRGKVDVSQYVGAIAVLLLAFGILAIFVFWFIFRIEIPQGKFGVVLYKGGLFSSSEWLNSPENKDPTAHNVINMDEAKEVKGIQRKILTEGWTFLNPIYYEVQIIDAQTIQKNYVGIRFIKDGNPIKNPEERLLAKPDERGVQEEVVPPGTQRFHPFLEEVEPKELLTLDSDKIGVLISYDGTTPPTGKLLASAGEKGIQEGNPVEGQLYSAPLGPGGQYAQYSNPYAYRVEQYPIVSIDKDERGVLISQSGNLPEDPNDIVIDNYNSKDKRVKGIERTLLNPGQHPINPYQYRVEPFKYQKVPGGKVGIKIARAGNQPTSGSPLSQNGEKGIQYDILKEGDYPNINPYEYTIELHDMVRIPQGHVGVVTSFVGKKPEVIKGRIQLSRAGERGVQKETLDPGDYRFNPYEKKITIIDIRSHNFQLFGKERLVFPSKDGFLMSVEASVEWQINPEKVSYVLMNIGNEQEILEKVIRPNMVSAGRIQGSKFTTEQFILGESREEFQVMMSKILKDTCESHGIIIHAIMVRDIISPQEISDIIKEKEIAIQEDLKNKQRIETAKSMAKLAREEAIKIQKQQEVKAETLKLTAATRAQQEKDVAITRATQELEVSKIDKQKAIISAEQRLEVAKIAAQKEKSVADIGQQQATIDASKKKEVAQIKLQETAFDAQSIIAKANAEAKSARKLFNADGGLELKLTAWREVMSQMAANKLIPRQIIQGAEKVITSEYVESFVKLMEGSLEKQLQYTPIEKDLKLRSISEVEVDLEELPTKEDEKEDK